MARKPASSSESGAGKSSAEAKAEAQQANTEERLNKAQKRQRDKQDKIKARFEKRSEQFEAAGFQTSDLERRFQELESKRHALEARMAEYQRMRSDYEAAQSSASEDDGTPEGDAPSSDEGVEYMGAGPRPSATPAKPSPTKVDTKTFNALANPAGQQAAAMMTEDYRAFMQGNEQIILAATGQAMKYVVDPLTVTEGAEMLAVLAVYQAAITAIGAEVALVAGFTKSEFTEK